VQPEGFGPPRASKEEEGMVQPPIYILGVSPRSGTNFLYDLIRLHPAVDIAHTVEEDFLLFGANHLQEYIDRVSGRWDEEWGISEGDAGELLRSIGEAGLQFLQKRQAHPGKRLLTKTPEAHNLSMLFDLFPEAQPIIIVRDGRAVVESKMKSFDADFNWASGAWAAAAQWILDFTRKTPPDRFRLVKYEDLHQHTHERVRSLLDYLNLDPDDYPFDKIDELPVRGSSAHFGDSGQLDWKPVTKTGAFKPLERFSHWTTRQHIEFNVLAGEQMTQLGYELQEPVFQRVELDRTTLDEEMDVITRLDRGSRVLMPRESGELLMGMDSFEGLHEHFSRSLLTQDELPRFIEFYEECSRSGLLVTREEFLASLTQAEEDDQRGELFGIFIRTCERPAYLERILASLLRSGGTATNRVFVLDDSRSTEARQANAGIVEKFRAEGAASFFYLGEEWQRGFIDQLTGAFPNYAGAIRYLLEPRPEGVFSAGRVLNLAMLAFAGQRLLTYDDDYIVDSCWQHPDARDKTLHLAGARAYCLQGYGSRDELVGGNLDLQLDPVAEHAALLGSTVSDLMSRARGGDWDVRLHGMGAQFARSLSGNSRFLTTSNGVMGQPISPDGLLGWFADGDATIPVWAGGKDYASWIAGHQVFQSSRNATVLQTTYGIPVGIDNSRIMPPTLPEGRREDSLFTFLLHSIHSTAVHFEFPWAIKHERDPLQWRQATMERPQAMALAQFIMLSLRRSLGASRDKGAPEAALATCGSVLREKSFLSDESLRTSALSHFQYLTSQHHARLLEALERPDLNDPAARADMESALEVSRKYQMTQPARPVWEDTHCPAEPVEQIQWVRQNLQLFGQSLQIWPVLWAWCRDNLEVVRPVDTTAGSPSVEKRSA
jgi:hypothetical protein